MTQPKRPLKVFLCHAHADRDAVRTLYTRLMNDGVDAWLDKEKLLPGQDWELEIKKAVREADVVVVCLSKQFNQAGFRQKEVRLALDTAMEKPEGEIFIIPARLEECDNLESLRKWHWVDLFLDDGYEMLMRALRARKNLLIHISEETNKKISGEKLPSAGLTVAKFHIDDRFHSERVYRTFDFGYIFLRLDQIKQTGAWGHSLIGCMKKISDRDLGSGWDSIRKEGGIITTTSCANAIASCWKSNKELHFQPFVTGMVNYFLERQSDNGGFGSIMTDKLGQDKIIRTQPRHTALAILALLDVEKNHQAIVKGLNYLVGANEAEYEQDYSAAMAVAFTIKAFEKCKNSYWFYNNLTDSQITTIFDEWESRKKLLLQYMSNLDANYYPFWKPYSDFSKFSYESFLLIADVFVDNMPQLLEERIEHGFLNLLEGAALHNGLPFNSFTFYPDVGITSFLLECVIRYKTSNQIRSPRLEALVENLLPLLFDFIVESVDKFETNDMNNSPMYYTYSTTVAKMILLLEQVSEADLTDHVKHLEDILDHIVLDFDAKEIRVGEDFEEWFAPYFKFDSLLLFLKSKLLLEQ